MEYALIAGALYAVFAPNSWWPWNVLRRKADEYDPEVEPLPVIRADPCQTRPHTEEDEL